MALLCGLAERRRDGELAVERATGCRWNKTPVTSEYAFCPFGLGVAVHTKSGRQKPAECRGNVCERILDRQARPHVMASRYAAVACSSSSMFEIVVHDSIANAFQGSNGPQLATLFDDRVESVRMKNLLCRSGRCDVTEA